MSRAPYGCHNRAAFDPLVLVQDGWIHTEVDGHRARLPRMKFAPFRMREDCSYANETDLGRADPRCVGCRWKKEGTQ